MPELWLRDCDSLLLRRNLRGVTGYWYNCLTPFNIQMVQSLITISLMQVPRVSLRCACPSSGQRPARHLQEDPDRAQPCPVLEQGYRCAPLQQAAGHPGGAPHQNRRRGEGRVKQQQSEAPHPADVAGDGKRQIKACLTFELCRGGILGSHCPITPQ